MILHRNVNIYQSKRHKTSACTKSSDKPKLFDYKMYQIFLPEPANDMGSPLSTKLKHLKNFQSSINKYKILTPNSRVSLASVNKPKPQHKPRMKLKLTENSSENPVKDRLFRSSMFANKTPAKKLLSINLDFKIENSSCFTRLKKNMVVESGKIIRASPIPVINKSFIESIDDSSSSSSDLLFPRLNSKPKIN